MLKTNLLVQFEGKLSSHRNIEAQSKKKNCLGVKFNYLIIHFIVWKHLVANICFSKVSSAFFKKLLYTQEKKNKKTWTLQILWNTTSI